MEWETEMKVLLIVLVFSKWPLATQTLLQESSLAGTPLSEAEYKDFFRILTTRRVIHAVCFRRAIFGCYDPIIQALDRYENHGVIPNGWICTDFPGNTSFPGFCDFALYRCSTRKYFAKRVLCPDETTEEPTVIQTNQEGTPEDSVASTTERPFELLDSTSTTSTESWPEPLATTETAAAETSATPLPNTETAAEEILSTPLPTTETATEETLATPLPTTETAIEETLVTPLPTAETAIEETLATPLPTTETAIEETLATPLLTTETAAIEISGTPYPSTTAKNSLLDLLSSSAVEMAAKLISKILDAFSATDKPSSESTTSEPLVELTPTSAAIDTPESFPELPATTTPTDEFSVDLTNAADIATETELNLATMAAITAPMQVTTPALTDYSSELAMELYPEATAMETFPEDTTMETFPEDTTVETFPEATAMEMFPEVTAMETFPEATAMEMFPEVTAMENFPETTAMEMFPEVTAMETFPESTSETPESVFDSAIHTTTTTSDTEPCVVDYPEPLDTSTDSTSILSIHTDATPAEAAAAAPSATTTTSPWPFVPGIHAVLPFPPPPPNKTMHIVILSVISDKNAKVKDIVGKNALSQTALGSGDILQQEVVQNPPRMNNLKDLLLRLHDNGLQQVMNTMQNGISREQKSSSLKLLNTLKSGFKKRLQR